MQRLIGKPIRSWTDEEIIALYADRLKATRYTYSAFLSFLLLRSYRRASLHLLTALPLYLGLQHKAALALHRQRLQQTQEQLRYAASSPGSQL